MRRDLPNILDSDGALGLGCFESFPTTENLLISDEAGRVPSDVGGLNVDAQPNSADMSDASLSPDVSNPGIIRDMGLREPTGDCRENQTCHGEPCRTRDGRNGFYICDEPLYSTECIEIPSGMSVPDRPMNSVTASTTIVMAFGMKILLTWVTIASYVALRGFTTTVKSSVHLL